MATGSGWVRSGRRFGAGDYWFQSGRNRIHACSSWMARHCTAHSDGGGRGSGRPVFGVRRCFVVSSRASSCGASDGVGAGSWQRRCFFMLAHFVKIPTELDHQPVHLWSGVSAVGAAFLPVGSTANLLAGEGIELVSPRAGAWRSLFTFRLALVERRFAWRLDSADACFSLPVLCAPLDHPNVEFFGTDILSSPLTSVVLILLGLWLWRFYQPYSTKPETGENAR